MVARSSETLVDRPLRSSPLLEERGWKAISLLKPLSRDKIKVLVWSLVILNLIDAGLTWVWVDLEIAEEANWLLRSLLEIHPTAFVAVKMAVVCMALGFIWKHRHNRLAVPGLVLACTVYSLLFVYHLQIALWSLHLWLPMNFPALIAG